VYIDTGSPVPNIPSKLRDLHRAHLGAVYGNWTRNDPTESIQIVRYNNCSYFTDGNVKYDLEGILQRNYTVVSNHFHSVKILLFSSARSRNFDGMFGTGLPV
jgi:hypothetical protein